MQQAQSAVVDAHHHLWRYNGAEFEWIDDRMAMLRRDFGTAGLTAAMDGAGVGRSIAVQARQTLAETDALLAAAREHPRIAGVVGWLPLADRAALEAALAVYEDERLLVGARHVVQDEAPGFLDGVAFNQGIARLGALELTYDLLLRADQLQEAVRFVDRHPRQRFVLDHLAKPRIAAGELEPWRRDFCALAARENVSCKISGMVTEDDWARWSPTSLRPFLDAAVEAFGPYRLMAGSDWPVCLVATGYARWWQVLREYFAEFGRDEQEAVLGNTAALFYSVM